MSDMGVSVHPRLLTEVVQFAARHNASVESIVTEALRTYMEDVGLGLLPKPKPATNYFCRTHKRRTAWY